MANNIEKGSIFTIGFISEGKYESYLVSHNSVYV